MSSKFNLAVEDGPDGSRPGFFRILTCLSGSSLVPMKRRQAIILCAQHTFQISLHTPNFVVNGTDFDVYAVTAAIGIISGTR